MREINERLAREVTKIFVTTLVDAVGKLVVDKCSKRRTGPSGEILGTDGEDFRMSIHLDEKDK